MVGNAVLRADGVRQSCARATANPQIAGYTRPGTNKRNKNKMMLPRRGTPTLLFALAVGASTFTSQEALSQTTEKSPWMVGFYVGALSDQRFVNILYSPWTVQLENHFMAALNVTYVAHEFQSLPINFEVDGVLAKRFGGGHDAWEVGLLPMVRWKAFPWNDYLYTNVRLGLTGPSYVSEISPWEISKSGNRVGSKFLNFLVPEITFSSGPDASWEAFVRVHHRSGAYGTINGVVGGSNYVSTGYRQRF